MIKLTKSNNINKKIKSTDTKIEVLLRKALWKEGFRFRKNFKDLPGKPDIVITKYKIAIFCDGEFWHGKNWLEKRERICINRNYWIPKIERNIKRDLEIDAKLENLGWFVLRFWGKDIQRDIISCIEDIKDTIFYIILDNYDHYKNIDRRVLKNKQCN